MVELARKARGMTQTELAEALDCKQAAISKIEQGLLGVSVEMHEGLARVLGYPKPFFEREGGIHAAGMKYRRARAALPAKVRDRLDAENNVTSFVLQELLESVSLPENRIPDLPTIEAGGPGEVARAVREMWKMPRGPITDLTAWVESAGAVVVHADFGTSQMDGVYYPFANLPHVVFLNRATPGDRMRFTLAHELGHIVMHQRRVDVEVMEWESDTFTGEFLMPEDDIRPHLYELTLPRLANLKRTWKVSMAALLYRAKDLGTITAHRYKQLWMEMGKAGFRKNEPQELAVAHERPRLLTDMVSAHLDVLNYTVAELSEAIRLDEADFRRFYLGERTALRLVKSIPLQQISRVKEQN